MPGCPCVGGAPVTRHAPTCPLYVAPGNHIVNSAELAAIDDVLAKVHAEMIRAVELHGPMRSSHEAYGVIAEEVDEFWDEVKANNLPKARTEAVQVAAMACRFLLDVHK